MIKLNRSHLNSFSAGELWCNSKWDDANNSYFCDNEQNVCILCLYTLNIRSLNAWPSYNKHVIIFFKNIRKWTRTICALLRIGWKLYNSARIYFTANLKKKYNISVNRAMFGWILKRRNIRIYIQFDCVGLHAKWMPSWTMATAN